MPYFAGPKRINMGDPLTYRICVQGYLEDVWSDRLASMTITANAENKVIPETVLIGRIRDQAELLGVLNGLYELRLPIIYVAIESSGEG